MDRGYDNHGSGLYYEQGEHEMDNPLTGGYKSGHYSLILVPLL